MRLRPFAPNERFADQPLSEVSCLNGKPIYSNSDPALHRAHVEDVHASNPRPNMSARMQTATKYAPHYVGLQRGTVHAFDKSSDFPRCETEQGVVFLEISPANIPNSTRFSANTHSLPCVSNSEPFLRHLAHAVLLRPPGTESAWRALIGAIRSGFSFHRERSDQSPEGAWICDEKLAQALSLRPRAPGLPHHRHPLTTDEAFAGLIVLLVSATAITHLFWRWL